MAVRFILGRSGTGKTSYCVKAIVNELLEGGRQNLILLVPEQATYQAERTILADRKVSGYHRLNVLSFDRLQFLLLGKNTARPAVSRIGRQMIVHRLLRENKSKLRIFDKSADFPGLSQQLAQTIAELHQYAKTPDDIEKLLEELAEDQQNSLAILKFADIGLIFGEYLKFIENNFLDPDAQLVRTCQAVPAAALAKNAKLWVDGFASFTEAELTVLTELLKVVKDAQIALCLDPSALDLANPKTEDIDHADLFNPTQRTYVELLEKIKRNKLQLAGPIVLKQAVRFSGCPPLAHVEKNIFKPKPAKIDSDGNVRIIAAPNARGEVQFVAKQILELVREKDYRYRDIAVIASDIESYQYYVRAYFEDYDIPFFIDKRKALNQHPIVHLVCSALQVVTDGFSHSDIFAYLKTDLVSLERYDIDLLENYCLAFGITASDWQSAERWSFTPEEEGYDEKRINQIRFKAVNPLLELRDNLNPAKQSNKMLTAEEFTRAIFNLLDVLKVREAISNWIEESNESEYRITADEHQQFYDKFVDIFDELIEVFGRELMKAEDYLAILSSAFSQLKLAFIPPALDQVLVGSIERSRHPDLKAVFLIGATQRQFPVPVGSERILTDDQREAAELADFRLAPTSVQMLTERQYLSYIAFTRPSELLCVTYPSVDDKGSAVPRSQFVDSLDSLFVNLQVESIAGDQLELEKIHNELDLVDLFCTRLGKDAFPPKGNGDSCLKGLLDDVCLEEQFASLGQSVLSAINYDNLARLDESVVKGLFSHHIQSSATRLGTFAACPYRHFARYVLELKERKEFKLEPLDLGLFYHSVLDALLKKLNEEKRNFATIADEELLRILNEQTQKIVQTSSFLTNFSRHSPHNEYIISSAIETLKDCVLAISQMVRAGSFKPSMSEVSFGMAKGTGDTLGQYKIALADNRILSLDGKIDRLDIEDVGNEKVTIIFDYKRKDTSFDWSKFYFGLNMQLPIYMLAVRHATGSKIKSVAGAFYMPVEVNPKTAALSELPKARDSFNYKAKGIFNGEIFKQLDTTANSGWSRYYNFRISSKDEQYGDYKKSGALKPDDFEKVLKFAQDKIIRLVDSIISGEIDIRPYRLRGQSPCSYCEFKSVCRFDWQINDYNSLISLGKSEVLEKIGTIDG